MGKKIWIFLDRDIMGKKLSQKRILERATGYFLENIWPKYEDEILYKRLIREKEHFGGVKTLFQFKGSDGLFLRAIKKRGIFLEDIFNELDLYELLGELNVGTSNKLKRDIKFHNKWEFLIQNQDGTPKTKSETLIEATEYLKKIIVPELISRGFKFSNDNLDYELLSDSGFGGFLTTLEYKFQISLNDLLISAGYPLNKDTSTFTFLDEAKVYEEKVRVASRFLVNELIPEMKENGLWYKGDGLNSKMMRNSPLKKHQRFIYAIHGRNIKFNDILKFAGYSLNIEHNKWDFLHYDKNGKIFSRKKVFEIAVDYFKINIIRKLMRKGIIKEGMVPFKSMVNNHSGFLYALWDGPYNISYTELVEAAGYAPHKALYDKTLARIGIDYHIILEKIFLVHTRMKNCKSYYELKVGNGRYDNLLVIDSNCFRLSSFISNFLRKYKKADHIIFDYYLGDTPGNLKAHINRGYQNNQKVLILVPVFAVKSETLPQIKNVEKFSPEDFTNFIGLKGELLDEFFEIIALAKSAIYNLSDRIVLRKKAIESRKIIKENFHFKEKEFSKLLILNRS